MLPIAPNYHRENEPKRPPRAKKNYTYVRANASHLTKPRPPVKPPSPPPSPPNALTRKKSLYLRAKDSIYLRHTKSFFKGKGRAVENEVEHEHTTDQPLIIPSTIIRLSASTSDLRKHISDQDKAKETELATALDSTSSDRKEHISQPSLSHGEPNSLDDTTLRNSCIHDGELSCLEGTKLPEIRIVEPEDEKESETNDENKKNKGAGQAKERSKPFQQVPKFAILSLAKGARHVAPRSISRPYAWFHPSSRTPTSQKPKSKALHHNNDNMYMMSGALQGVNSNYNYSIVNDHMNNKIRSRNLKKRNEYNARGRNVDIQDAVGPYDEHYISECRTGRLMRTVSFVHPTSLNLTAREDDDEELELDLLDRVHIKVARREAAMQAAAEQRRIEEADRLFVKLMFEKIHEQLRPVALQSLDRRCKEATEKIKRMLEERRAVKLLANPPSIKDQGSAVVANDASEKIVSNRSSSALINNRLSSSSVVLTPMASDTMRKRLSSGSTTVHTPSKRLSSGNVVEEMSRNCSTSERAIRRAERDAIRRSSAAMSEEMMRKAMANEDPDSSDLGIYEPSLDMTGYKFGEDVASDNGVGNVVSEDGPAADRAVTDDAIADEVAADGAAQDEFAVDGVTKDGVVEAVDGQRLPRLRSMRVFTGQGKRSRRISGEGTENWWINMR